MVSDFEIKFDGLVGDGSSIFSEFVDWESSGNTYKFNELRDVLCGEANMCFNPERLFLFGLAYTGRDSKKIWTTRTIELEGIEFQRHPQDLETLLNFDTRAEIFNFQKSLNIDAINNETLCIDRKAHLFWENTTIDAKVKELMSILSLSGKASTRLIMTGDSKDGKLFFNTKRMEQESGIKHELGFVDSLFMMH